jgi:hypothetical protein
LLPPVTSARLPFSPKSIDILPRHALIPALRAGIKSVGRWMINRWHVVRDVRGPQPLNA